MSESARERASEAGAGTVSAPSVPASADDVLQFDDHAWVKSGPQWFLVDYSKFRSFMFPHAHGRAVLGNEHPDAFRKLRA